MSLTLAYVRLRLQGIREEARDNNWKDLELKNSFLAITSYCLFMGFLVILGFYNPATGCSRPFYFEQL